MNFPPEQLATASRTLRGSCWLRRVCLLVVAGHCTVPSAIALDPTKPISGYTHRWWRNEEGLPQESVHSIVQAKDGYFWLSTDGGLARFDGVRFTVFDRRTSPVIRDNAMRDVIEDKDSGSLVIATWGGGIIRRFPNGKFDVFDTRGLVSPRAAFLFRDRDDGIWVSAEGKITRFHQGQGQVVQGDPTDSRATLLGRVAQDDRGDIWTASNDGLKKVVNGQATTPYRASNGLLSDFVTTVHYGRRGTLWIGTSAGVNRLDNGVLSSVSLDGAPSVHVTQLLEDRDGNLWIGTRAGLYRLTNGKLSAYSQPQGLTGASVTALYEANDGSLWVGTQHGLDQFANARFTTLTDGSGDDFIRSITQDADGTVWVAKPEGLSAYRDGRFEPVPTPIPESESLYSIYSDPQGGLWVGGLEVVYRQEGGQWKQVMDPDGRPFGALGFTRNRDGALWMANSKNLGVRRVRGDEWKTFTTEDGLPSNRVNGVLADRAGRIWVLTAAGLARFEDGKFRVVTTQDGLPHDYIHAIHEDAEGALWISTRGGLALLRNDQISSFTIQEGLPNEGVGSLGEDLNGGLWIGCSRGIFHVKKAEFIAVAEHRASAVNPTLFNRADGIVAGSAAGQSPSVLRRKDGSLWFCTSSGVAVIRPEDMQFTQTSPPVLIESVRVDGKPMEMLKDIVTRFPPGEGGLGFEYTALSYQSPERVTFKYRLEGFETAWVDAGSRREAFYTRVPPGSYTFRVEARNSDGVWARQPAAFSFYLRPHWYQTWVFRGLAGIGVLLAVAGGYKVRVRLLEQRQHELEERVAERTIQLSSANAELEAFSYSVSHDLRAPLRGIDGFSQALLEDYGDRLDTLGQDYLRRVRKASQRMERLIDDMLTLSRITRSELRRTTVDLSALSDSIARKLLSSAPDRNVSFVIAPHMKINCDSNLVAIAMENLLGNAWKFTSKREHARIEVGSFSRDGELVHYVRDNGAGFDMAFAANMFGAFQRLHSSAEFEGTGIGLATVRRIIHRHGGRVWAEGTIDQGATLFFTLPA